MPKSETLHVLGLSQPLSAEELVVYAADKEEGQMSMEPLQEISINNRSMRTDYFSAISLGRRVRGYYSADTPHQVKGEIDIVTPLAPGAVEEL